MKRYRFYHSTDNFIEIIYYGIQDAIKYNVQFIFVRKLRLQLQSPLA